MLSSPLFPPCAAIVFGIRVIDIGREAFDRVFEGREEWRLGIPKAGSITVRVEGKGTHNKTGFGSWARLSVHATAPGS